MGRAKEKLENGMSFEEYLKSILDNIDDLKVKGIAKLAIDKGFDNLTEKQQYTLNKGIETEIMTECPNENCKESISYEDMQTAIYNGQCSLCQSRLDKIQSE